MNIQTLIDEASLAARVSSEKEQTQQLSECEGQPEVDRPERVQPEVDRPERVTSTITG